MELDGRVVMNVLVLNAGSSSLKYKLIAVENGGADGGETLSSGNVEVSGEGMAEASMTAIRVCRERGARIDAIGHRLVHGGPDYRDPVRIGDEVIKKLRGLRELDPLHNPPEVALIEASAKALPGVPGVAVFDTAFHATLPEVAWRYALPRGWSDELGLRRYGFHGISYQHSVRTLAKLRGGEAPQKTVICHLGSGASVCALLDGRSVDTSMGLTPLEGLLMGTRCGDMDPGLLMYLLRENKIGLQELDDLLNHQSGLAGLAEGSGGDLRKIEAAQSDTHAEAALACFAYRAKKYIGGYAAALGGLDALVFTGGIGEHSAPVRARICSGLQFLGVELDGRLNERPESGPSGVMIGADGAAASVWVIPADEELETARQTAELLSENLNSK